MAVPRDASRIQDTTDGRRPPGARAARPYGYDKRAGAMVNSVVIRKVVNFARVVMQRSRL